MRIVIGAGRLSRELISLAFLRRAKRGEVAEEIDTGQRRRRDANVANEVTPIELLEFQVRVVRSHELNFRSDLTRFHKRQLSFVAQIFNLPYRRLEVGRVSPATTGGLQIRDTAEYNSALLLLRLCLRWLTARKVMVPQ